MKTEVTGVLQTSESDDIERDLIQPLEDINFELSILASRGLKLCGENVSHLDRREDKSIMRPFRKD